ncbi:putative metal-binding motif-containing protein [Sandaracinus amylolyticus]|uniref:Tryptophan synthase alpha chain n=1 Tax=Sandaracinus amylolyticus TaxID=927083 RepID=A0A0F6YMZ5_9BACT|nr:putative metal-binding motif-containing protein [Sandaracinus amylolyticus]AKF10697.1 Tryptophan synthase alpha chain [Sandaracinus amylolyticus]
MRTTSFAYAVFVCLISLLAPPARVHAQATCVDATGDACRNVLRTARPDGVVNDVFTTRDGLYGPQLSFASYVRGANGCYGVSDRPTILEGYTCTDTGVPALGADRAPYANSLDWYWTQVYRTRDDGVTFVGDGEPGFYEPSRGRIYDLGGEANRVVLFPITDHPPLPCEAFEYSVYLSNDPNATVTASPDAPNPLHWNPARLIRAYEQGWTRNPTARGASEAARPDLGTWLRDNSAGEAVSDALVTVWALPCGLSFRYASIVAGNYGNPGPECVYHSNEDELDAVAGLNEDDTAICIDADGDGHRAASCGGSDCDDSDPAVHPGAFEPCDATRDLDCMPMAECPSGTRCESASGLCVTTCFEGGCGAGFTCTGSGLCVESACAARTEPCPAGTICRAGECRAPCDGVVCPRGQVCTGGACIDPCAGVVCPVNQTCIAGTPGAVTLCGPACTCDEISTPLCGEGRACDARADSPTRGECVDPGCETATCAASEVCVGGSCVDACAGVTCPIGQRCDAGACVVDRCASVTCPGGRVCRAGECVDACEGVTCGEGERCRNGACMPDPCAGITCAPGFVCNEGTCVVSGPQDAGGNGMDGGGRGPRGTTDGGCCRVAGGGDRGTSGVVLLVIALAIVIAARRRG